MSGQRIGYVRVSTLDQNAKRQLGDQILDRVFADNAMLSVMGAFAEFERSLIRERQREGIALAQQRGVYKERKKTLTPERASELVERAGDDIPKVVLAQDYGISRETVYQYLRHAKLE